jgi:hypothetical protein
MNSMVARPKSARISVQPGPFGIDDDVTPAFSGGGHAMGMCRIRSMNAIKKWLNCRYLLSRRGQSD